MENNKYGMYIKAKNYIFIVTIENNQSQIAQNSQFHNDGIHHLDPLFAYQLFKVIESNLSPSRVQNQYKIDFNDFSKKIMAQRNNMWNY